MPSSIYLQAKSDLPSHQMLLFFNLKFKAFINADAGIETNNPAEGQASLLEFYKKAISFSFPWKNATWNPQVNVGNPTKSVEVNELINIVKKCEDREGMNGDNDGQALHARCHTVMEVGLIMLVHDWFQKGLEQQRAYICVPWMVM